MRKVIKIGFPILCVAVIGGTFILLNKTTDRINKNRLKDDEVENEVVETTELDSEEIENESVEISSEEAKAQEVKNKSQAIELVKKLAPSVSNSYYTNEGMADDKYLVAIRDSISKDATIYYAVDIQNEKIEIYVK